VVPERKAGALVGCIKKKRRRCSFSDLCRGLLILWEEWLLAATIAKIKYWRIKLARIPSKNGGEFLEKNCTEKT
jgi:hypothetical protein